MNDNVTRIHPNVGEVICTRCHHQWIMCDLNDAKICPVCKPTFAPDHAANDPIPHFRRALRIYTQIDDTAETAQEARQMIREMYQGGQITAEEAQVLEYFLNGGLL